MKHSDNSSRRVVAIFIVVVTVLLNDVGTAQAQEFVEEWVSISRYDGSDLDLLVSRPGDQIDLPILLVIDGSGCGSVARPGFRGSGLNYPEFMGRFARVAVEKPGVERGQSGGETCSDEFRRRYSLDQRVFDHLRALQHLRRRADWWDGSLYVFGWSDGASIAVRVAAYAPETIRAVFGGMGGGWSMAQDFEETSCSNTGEEPTMECLLLRERLEEIRRNPSSERTWLGAANSWRTWETRLDGVEANVLIDADFPFLMIHGELSSEVASARALAEQLERSGGPEFEAWEVPDMGHDLGTIPGAQAQQLGLAVLQWLFGEQPGPGGPPVFGVQ